MTSNILLNINNLKICFYSDDDVIYAVNGVNLEIRKGEIVGLVGESGCGKSVTALSILRLLPSKISKVIDGKIIFDGISILDLKEKEIRKIRGKRIAMVFQDPMTSLNPSLSIGEQISEVFRLHQGLSYKDAYNKTINLLNLVKIPNPEKRYFQYPHQFSGGMRQRIMIAMALSCNPDLIIADEPTTALDVTIQAQIIELLKEIIREFKSSVLLITHDLGLVYQICQKVYIMYAGLIVEVGDVKDIFFKPYHPYTNGLLNCLPKLKEDKEYLNTIKGAPSEIKHEIIECPFKLRCEISDDECIKLPPLREKGKEHYVRCWKA